MSTIISRSHAVSTYGHVVTTASFSFRCKHLIKNRQDISMTLDLRVFNLFTRIPRADTL